MEAKSSKILHLAHRRMSRRGGHRTAGLCLVSICVVLWYAPLADSFGMPALSTWYFTCRHTFESTLAKELASVGVKKCHEVAPGLLRVQDPDLEFDPLQPLGHGLDLTYALQVMPECRTVRRSSIKDLALGALEEIDLAAESGVADVLRSAPRGSLSVHALVPDNFKGGKNPRGLRRCLTVADKLRELLRKSFPAARNAKKDDSAKPDEQWLIQLLLLNTEVLEVSMAKCATSPAGGTWPCWHIPAGLAQVDIDKEKEPMPSSAYRKLEESFACMNIQPAAGDLCVDLGACPGGWTKALRRKGCRVAAIDRSELVRELMVDKDVAFIQGDAFSFDPFASGHEVPWSDWKAPVDWMVSDVIATPDRVTELLDKWCAEHWARQMVVTMKFKGEPDWNELEKAREVSEQHGYAFRSKHFFNNKNEVSLMLRQREG